MTNISSDNLLLQYNSEHASNGESPQMHTAELTTFTNHSSGPSRPQQLCLRLSPPHAPVQPPYPTAPTYRGTTALFVNLCFEISLMFLITKSSASPFLLFLTLPFQSRWQKARSRRWQKAKKQHINPSFPTKFVVCGFMVDGCPWLQSEQTIESIDYIHHSRSANPHRCINFKRCDDLERCKTVDGHSFCE